MADSDDKLVEKAKKGDRGAFERLVARHQRMALNTAYRILRNREDAEDAAQESFIRVYTFLSTLREGTKFTSWLYRIVTNVCLSKMKETSSQQIFVEADGEEAEAKHPELSDGTVNPEEVVAKDEFNGQIRELVVSLPPHYRAIITLYHLNDLSYHEIAETLGLPMGTVKTHLYRAKAMLKKAILKRYRTEELCL